MIKKAIYKNVLNRQVNIIFSLKIPHLILRVNLFIKKKRNLLLNLNWIGHSYSGAFIPIIPIASTTVKQTSMVYSYPSRS
jgi:hypothetical protein